MSQVHSGLVVYFSVLAMAKLSHGSTVTEITEVGERVTLSCPLDKTPGNQERQLWYSVSHTVFATCYPKNNSQSYTCSYHSYLDFFSIKVSDSDNSMSELSFNASKTIHDVYCKWGSTEKVRWHITNYVRPKDLTCHLTTTDSYRSMTVKCATSEIYPNLSSAKCVIFTSKDNGSFIKKPNIPTYGPQTVNGVTGTGCSFSIQAADLGTGTHRLKVNMYPDFTGSNTTHGEDFTHFGTDIVLSYPKPEIFNCPFGSDADVTGDYIKSGSLATCQCRQKTHGVPPGTVTFTQGVTGAVPGNLSGTISGNIEHPGPGVKDVTVKCEARSSLGNAKPDTTSKDVHFAYGPTSVNVTSPTPSPLRVCHGDDSQVTFNCFAEDVSPQAAYTIFVDGSQSSTTSSATVTLAGGPHVVKCVAKNTKFSDLLAEISTSFTVLSNYV